MISDVDKQKYIEHPYSCPYCQNDKIQILERLCDFNIVTQIVNCYNCGKSWAEIYHLVDIEEMDDNDVL